MDERELLVTKIKESQKFVECSCLDICFAMWLFYEDIEDWRFIIAGKNIDSILDKSMHIMYREINKCMESCDVNLDIQYIKPIRTNSKLIIEISSLIKVSGIANAYFESVSLNDLYICKAYIIRVDCT